jgi:hypothetical protein
VLAVSGALGLVLAGLPGGEAPAARALAQAPPSIDGARLVAFASPALAVLVGPLTELAPGGSGPSGYDGRLLRLARQHGGAFPADRQDLVSSNYYDLALVLYVVHYRTGAPEWLPLARRVARAWRDAPNNRAIAAALAGDETAGRLVPPPRGMATLGLAVLALEAGDGDARRVVHEHARLVEERWVNTTGDYGLANPVMPLGDPREAGYALMALVASTLLGEDHTSAARRLLDAILARQQPAGHWRGWSEEAPGRPYTLNYMNGLLMEALVLYDRAVGDARIVPALARAVDGTWRQQWSDGARAFRYGDAAAGDTSPAPILNGLMLPAWGYLYARTGEARYREQGDRMLAGLVRALDHEVHGAKQFAQSYRSSARYLAFRLGAPSVSRAAGARSGP